MTRLNVAVVATLALIGPVSAWAHGENADPIGTDAAPFGPPVDDRRVYVHALLDEFEYRATGSASVSRWEGEAWIGTDSNRLWLKSEGEIDRHGNVKEGLHEVLFDRPITSYFDVQAGLRYDLDSAAGRAWGALGVEGLAPHFLRLSATLYASDGGHVAAKAKASYDLLLTQRLIVQPSLEMNAYTREDAPRRIGSGISSIDAGLRLRYEVTRKFAPYVGLAYQRAFSSTALFIRQAGESDKNFSVLIGVRSWL